MKTENDLINTAASARCKIAPNHPPTVSTVSDFSRCVRTQLPVEICDPAGDVGPVPSPGGPCLDFVASDSTLDRYGEIITASGWQLENYQRNPVFQNCHQYGDILFTLGRALVTEIRPAPPREAPNGPSTLNPQPSTCLFQRIQFATDANPMARIAYNLYRGKFLSAVSVGFVPIRWEDGTEKSAYRRKYLEQELLEVSAVAIPANPNALALGLKSGAVEKSDVKDLADLLRMTLDPTHSKSSSSSISASSPDSRITHHASRAQLLRRLAHEIRTILNS